MKQQTVNHLFTLSLFLLILVLNILSPAIKSGDSMWSIPVALSIINKQQTNLDPYVDLIRQSNGYAVERVGGHYYCLFPLGTKLMAVPVVAVARIWLTDSEIIQTRARLEKITASIMVALAATFIYLIAKMFLGGNLAVFVAFVFSFCTPVWSTCSTALWQHGPSVLMLTIALYLVLKARSSPWLIQLAGIPLAFSYVIRPTNSISILLFTVYIFVHYRKQFFKFVIWSALVGIPFVAFNLWVYGDILQPYYYASRLKSGNFFFEALGANIFSPGRGLLVFTPVFVLSILGMALSLRKPLVDKLDYYLLVIVFLHWVAISSFPQWWTGHSFGPRFFSDMIPLLIYFLILFLRDLSRLGEAKRICMWALVILLTGASFFIHLMGAINPGARIWNVYPVNVDEATYRIWDWNDLQFLRGIRELPDKISEKCYH